MAALHNYISNIFSNVSTTPSENYRTTAKPSLVKKPINIDKLKTEWEEIKKENDPIKITAFYTKLNTKIVKHQNKYLSDSKLRRVHSAGIQSLSSDSKEERSSLDKRALALNEAKRFERLIKQELQSYATAFELPTPQLLFYQYTGIDKTFKALQDFSKKTNIDLKMKKIIVEDNIEIIIFNLSKLELESIAIVNKDFRDILSDKSINNLEIMNEESVTEELLKKADIYFKALGDTRINFDPPSLNKRGRISDEKLIHHYLSDLDSRGLIIGESHADTTPKEFIINNMDILKKNGVTTIYLEHLFYDTMQKEIDDYLMDPNVKELPMKISAYLDRHEFTSRFGTQIKKTQYQGYGLKDVIIAAKQAGIRVVGIDTVRSYQCGFDKDFGVRNATKLDRVKGMNFVSQEIIQKEQRAGKYLILCGFDHAGTSSKTKIPGLNEILAIPTICIMDKNKKSSDYVKETRTEFNFDLHTTSENADGNYTPESYRNISAMIVRKPPK